jgi:hypothetical protein
LAPLLPPLRYNVDGDHVLTFATDDQRVLSDWQKGFSSLAFIKDTKKVAAVGNDGVVYFFKVSDCGEGGAKLECDVNVWAGIDNKVIRVAERLWNTGHQFEVSPRFIKPWTDGAHVMVGFRTAQWAGEHLTGGST